MRNEEFKENEENISPSIQNGVEDQNVRRERGSISVGSALLKVAVCAKPRNPLIPKQCRIKEVQNVSKVQ